MNFTNIVIINYTGNRQNWGCQATSQGLEDMLKRIFSNKCNLEYIPLLNQDKIDIKLEAQYADRLTEIMKKEELPQKDRDEVTKIVLKRYSKKYIDLVKNADFIFFQAEGTMTGHSFYGGLRLLLLPFYSKVVLKKKVFSLNQTIYSATEKFETVIKHVFSKFDIIALREVASFEYAKQLGLKRIVMIPDAAFLSKKKDVPFLKANEQYFAVTGTAKMRKLSKKDYVSLIREIQCKFNIKPLITVSTNADKEILKEIEENWPKDSYAVLDPNSSHEEVVGAFSRCRFLIGGRYHMCILSAVARTPFVCLIANTFKNEGLMKLLELNYDVLSFEDKEAILSNVREVIENEETLREHLDHQVKRVCEMINKGENLIKELVIDEKNLENEDIVNKYPLISPKNNYDFKIDKTRMDLYSKLNSPTKNSIVRLINKLRRAVSGYRRGV